MLDPFLIISLIIVPLLLCASAFFSGCETALFSLSESQRVDLQKNKNKSRRIYKGARVVATPDGIWHKDSHYLS